MIMQDFGLWIRVRAKKVFGQKQFIIVSQRFHCERGIYIAGNMGCTAYGYPAGDVSGPWHLKVRLREVLARCKAVFDVAFNSVALKSI